MIVIMTCLSCPSHSQQLPVRQVQLQELSVSSLRNLCQAPNGTGSPVQSTSQATNGLMQAMQFNKQFGDGKHRTHKNADDVGVFMALGLPLYVFLLDPWR